MELALCVIQASWRSLEINKYNQDRTVKTWIGSDQIGCYRHLRMLRNYSCCHLNEKFKEDQGYIFGRNFSALFFLNCNLDPRSENYGHVIE